MSYPLKTVYHKQGSTEFVCSDGAKIVIESGGKFYNESVFDTTAATTAIPNYGLTIITTTAASVSQLEAPEKGIRKEIISLSTFVQKIKTVAGTRLSGSTLARVASFAANTTQGKIHGGGGRFLSLVGRSTAVWAVTGKGGTTGGSSGVALTAVVTLTSTT